MTSDFPPSTLDRMEAMLRRCRRRIILAGILARLRTGLRTALRGLPVIAAVFLALRFAAWSFGTPAPGVVHVLAAFAVFAAIVFLRALMFVIRKTAIHPAQAAERLDLAQATHNRIATAISLLRSGDDSPFARAAVRDGCEHLERLHAEAPHVEVPPISWHRTGISLAAGLGMLVVGLLLAPKPGAVGTGQGAGFIVAVDKLPAPEPPVPERADTLDPRFAGFVKTHPGGHPVPRSGDSDKDEEAKRPEPGSESRSDGAMARHASGESRSSQAASNSGSAANGEGAKSKPGEGEPGKPPKPRDSRRQTVGTPKADPKEEKKEGGSIDARGSSGAGSMQSAQNEWSSNVKAKSDDSDDFQNEEEPDEDMDPDKQRLGAQPSLKNRAARVSRELSLFTGTEVGNEQNRGRGGPGGQKKARGTATMIMGVPIPGFVRGRLLPGPTKSTQEEVEPSPVPGDHADGDERPQARPEEEPQERYHPAAADSIRARNYLLNYHSEHDRTPEGSNDSK